MRRFLGFTLIEVLVALWIVSSVFAMIITMNVQNIKLAQKSSTISTVSLLALREAEAGVIKAKGVEIEDFSLLFPDFKIEKEVFDIGSFPIPLTFFVPNIPLPPIPIVIITTPEGETYEFLSR